MGGSADYENGYCWVYLFGVYINCLLSRLEFLIEHIPGDTTVGNVRAKDRCSFSEVVGGVLASLM